MIDAFGNTFDLPGPTVATGTLGLYVVHRGDEVGYDETTAYVAAARDEAHARKLGETCSGDQPASVWYAPETAVTRIGTADPQVDPGIVIADYHAG